jgi:hypothetical protein
MNASRKADAGSLHQRQTGPIGTGLRAILGIALLFGLGIPGGVTMIHGRYQYEFDVPSVILGAVVFPAAVLGWHWWYVRRHQAALRATGPVATTINMLVLLALFLVPWYAPRFYYIATAAAVFYGVSMLLAAVRGRAGCEVTAISNWVLGRDDQVGCPVFTPIDSMERPARA